MRTLWPREPPRLWGVFIMHFFCSGRPRPLKRPGLGTRMLSNSKPHRGGQARPLMKAMRPDWGKKGNEQVSVMAVPLEPCVGLWGQWLGWVPWSGYLWGSPFARCPSPGRGSLWVFRRQGVWLAWLPAAPSPIGACGGSSLLPAPPPPGSVVPWLGGGCWWVVGC